jgi:hypothetical protein
MSNPFIVVGGRIDPGGVVAVGVLSTGFSSLVTDIDAQPVARGGDRTAGAAAWRSCRQSQGFGDPR